MILLLLSKFKVTIVYTTAISNYTKISDSCTHEAVSLCFNCLCVSSDGVSPLRDFCKFINHIQ